MHAGDISAIHGARVLLNLGDSVTTDHISPAGSIARTSSAARWLTAQKYVSCHCLIIITIQVSHLLTTTRTVHVADMMMLWLEGHLQIQELLINWWANLAPKHVIYHLTKRFNA